MAGRPNSIETKCVTDHLHYLQSFGSQLWDCTLATQAIIATGMVQEYGDSLKKAHFYIKESQVNFTKLRIWVFFSFFLKRKNMVLLKKICSWT